MKKTKIYIQKTKKHEKFVKDYLIFFMVIKQEKGNAEIEKYQVRTFMRTNK